MPLIMEDSIDVDELFGDPTSLELGLGDAAPTIKGLPQRIDELRLSGCSQYALQSPPPPLLKKWSFDSIPHEVELLTLK